MLDIGAGVHSGERWVEAEDEAIRTLYGKRSPKPKNIRGLAMRLQRSPGAITARAAALGVSRARRDLSKAYVDPVRYALDACNPGKHLPLSPWEQRDIRAMSRNGR